MKIPPLMFALASALAGTVDAQPSMTIYGTFKKDEDPQPLDAASSKSVFINDGAPSSISMYGTIHGGIRHVTNTIAAGGSTTTQGSNGEYYNNRLGIKGTEDLGGGLNVHFHLESGFNTGTGALDNTTNRLFNRISSIGTPVPSAPSTSAASHRLPARRFIPTNPFSIAMSISFRWQAQSPAIWMAG